MSEKSCPAPPPPSQKKLSPIEQACHDGYKTGYSQGRTWAKIISRNKGTFKEGKSHLECLTSYLKKKNTLFNSCAYMAVHEAFKRFWWLENHPKHLREYQNNMKAYKVMEI